MLLGCLIIDYWLLVDHSCFGFIVGFLVVVAVAGSAGVGVVGTAFLVSVLVLSSLLLLPLVSPGCNRRGQ